MLSRVSKSRAASHLAGERALKFSTWSMETVRTPSFQLFIQGLARHQGSLAGAPGHCELGT